MKLENVHWNAKDIDEYYCKLLLYYELFDENIPVDYKNYENITKINLYPTTITFQKKNEQTSYSQNYSGTKIDKPLNFDFDKYNDI